MSDGGLWAAVGTEPPPGPVPKDEWFATSTAKAMGRSAARPIYREVFGSGLGAAGFTALLVSGFVLVPAAFEGTIDGLVLGFALFMGFPWLLGIVSVAVYGQIALYPDRLRVGRHVLPLSWLDSQRIHDLVDGTTGSVDGITGLDGVTRPGGAEAAALLRENAQLLGGAWRGPWFSSERTVLSDRWGREYGIPVRHPGLLLTHLRQLLPAPPADRH